MNLLAGCLGEQHNFFNCFSTLANDSWLRQGSAVGRRRFIRQVKGTKQGINEACKYAVAHACLVVSGKRVERSVRVADGGVVKHAQNCKLVLLVWC